MLIGFITKEMFYDSSIRTLQSPVNLISYRIPLEHLCPFDIGRKIWLDENNVVVVETMVDKIRRSKFLFEVEKIENRAIVNIDTNGEYIEPTAKLSNKDVEKVNKDVID